MAEVSFRPSVPRLKMASILARSEYWEYWTQRVASAAEFYVMCDARHSCSDIFGYALTFFDQH